MYHETRALWKNLLKTGLDEDRWPWDWTSLALPKSGAGRVRAKVIAKSPGVWVGNGLIDAINEVAPELFGTKASFKAIAKTKDGATLKPGQTVSEWEGSARSVLALERTFINLASFVSGIATATRKLVDQVELACPNHPPRIIPTRKTLPAYRDLSILGVCAGGGYSHRVDLSGGVLIKENHIASAGSIARAIEGARAVAPHGLKIEIEVTNAKELSQALAARADGVLLDNFSPQEVRSALQLIEKQAVLRPVVEVSGGLNEGNIAHYVIEGVDVLSVGSLTHSVKAIDLSLLVQ